MSTEGAGALVVGLEVALRYSAWGIALRAVGSDKVSAAKIGARTRLLVISAYVLSSLFAVVGGFIVAMQLGIGDANQGVDYTLSSVAAVVLGGASLFGGRGSFVSVMLGAVLLVMVNSAMSFLGLSGAWQYWFMGGLILLSVSAYSKVGGRG